MAATKTRPAESENDANDAGRLSPYQVCFVVDAVESAAAECAARFGWGPFRSFRATVESLEYRGRPARRVAEVALGMAGGVQVELLHVHEGVDCLAAYQGRYERGFQHLGIDTPSRGVALERLEKLGARLDHLDEFEGIRIAFVDVPGGPGLFELVDRTSGRPSGGGAVVPEPGATPRVAIDRATLVTDRVDETLDFFASAFGWRNRVAKPATLRWDGEDVKLQRVLGVAGRLEVEIVAGRPGGRDPYSRHLARGEHGLVHAGGVLTSPERPDAFVDRASQHGQWLETGERFTLVDWSGGVGTLQLRATRASKA